MEQVSLSMEFRQILAALHPDHFQDAGEKAKAEKVFKSELRRKNLEEEKFSKNLGRTTAPSRCGRELGARGGEREQYLKPRDSSPRARSIPISSRGSPKSNAILTYYLFCSLGQPINRLL